MTQCSVLVLYKYLFIIKKIEFHTQTELNYLFHDGQFLN